MTSGPAGKGSLFLHPDAPRPHAVRTGTLGWLTGILEKHLPLWHAVKTELNKFNFDMVSFYYLSEHQRRLRRIMLVSLRELTIGTCPTPSEQPFFPSQARVYPGQQFQAQQQC